MSYYVLCTSCGELLEVDENGKSIPNADYKLIDDHICENCGRDLSATLKRAVEEAIPRIIALKKK